MPKYRGKRIYSVIIAVFLLLRVVFLAACSDNTPPAKATGTITEFRLPTAGSSPDGIVAGPDGNVWFTEKIGDKIGRITSDGTITEFSLPNPNVLPGGITKGPDGNIWFAELGGNIGRITPNGTITEFPLMATPTLAEGLAAGPDGALWFTDRATGNIGRAMPGGTA